MPRPPETFPFTWRDLACRIDHVRDHKIDGWSRLVLRVVSPRGAPLPVSENGYHVVETEEDKVVAAGGPVAYFTALLDREALHPRYAQALFKWKQADLFAR